MQSITQQSLNAIKARKQREEMARLHAEARFGAQAYLNQQKSRRIKRNLTTLIAAVLVSLGAGKAMASDVNCLSRIIYAETAGHSVEHAVAIGQAAVTKAEDDEVGICQLRGVKRKQPPNSMLEYYKVLAKQLLDKPKTTVSKGADHWNQGTKPQYPGEVKRQFNNQVLYILASVGEKR